MPLLVCDKAKAAGRTDNKFGAKNYIKALKPAVLLVRLLTLPYAAYQQRHRGGLRDTNSGEKNRHRHAAVYAGELFCLPGSLTLIQYPYYVLS